MQTHNQSEGHQQHPISVYFKVWGLLFVLSSFSYLVDILQLQGALRWTLILVFMFLNPNGTPYRFNQNWTFYASNFVTTALHFSAYSPNG